MSGMMLDIEPKFYSGPPPPIHHPNLLFSLVNMSNILFYTMFTHACDLAVKVTDLDIFIYAFC